MTTESPHMKQLSTQALCRGLDERQVAEIFDICDECELRAGEVLFEEGDDGDALYTLLDGEIEITKSDGNGGNQPLARMSGGAVLGEMSLFGPHSNRSATATALKRCALLKVSVSKFESLVKAENVAALKVVHNLAQLMSRRLVLMNEKLVDASRGQRKEELLAFQKILNDWSF